MAPSFILPAREVDMWQRSLGSPAYGKIRLIALVCCRLLGFGIIDTNDAPQLDYSDSPAARYTSIPERKAGNCLQCGAV